MIPHGWGSWNGHYVANQMGLCDVGKQVEMMEKTDTQSGVSFHSNPNAPFLIAGYHEAPPKSSKYSLVYVYTLGVYLFGNE